MKLAVLGCGHLASAVVSKLNAIEVHTYTPSFVKAQALAELTKGTAHRKLGKIPKCDFYMLGMKPQQFSQFAEEFKEYINTEATLISLLAGTDVSTLSSSLGINKVVRVMSNTPALIGEGLHSVFFKNVDSKVEREQIIKILKISGEVLTLNTEDQIDAITHFSGSGPAYLFDLARILTDELTSRGIESEAAALAIKQTLFGASTLLLKSDSSATELRSQVTSKNGVTEQVLKSLWDSNLEESWKKALKLGDQKIKQLKGKSK